MRMGVMMGAVEKTAEQTIQEMEAGVRRFRETNPQNLKKITFVVYNDDQTKLLMEKTFEV